MMFEWVCHWVLRFLRVPREPDPPFGEPASLRVFRASRKLYWLRLIGWGTAQVAALIGIIFWIGVLMAAEHEARTAQTRITREERRAPVRKQSRHRPFSESFRELAAGVPQSLYGWLWVAKGLGVVIYLGQLAVSYAAVRLDYEMRWYLVTDRSLRIRSGLWNVQELTMSFANLQQVIVSQGPLQRLLGIADVRVQSAGGGSAGEKGQGHADTTHTGVFHGVEHAVEVRDLILERLRHFRETGLGDPDEVLRGPIAKALPASADALDAARELLEETRQLSRVILPH